MDAQELERRINKKFGFLTDHVITEDIHLIRTQETQELVFLDCKSIGDGHHLLRHADQGEIDRIVEHFGFTDEGNDLIPD